MSIFKRLFGYLLNPRPEYQRTPGATAVVHPERAEDLAAPRPRMRPRFNLPLAVGGLILVGLLVIVLFGPLWAQDNAYVTSLSILPGYDVETGQTITLPLPPSSTHLLGTDVWGNDMLSLLLYGARVTLIVGALITLARILLGTILGSLAGWFAGRLTDQIIMAAISIVASLPMLLSSMILVLALDVEKGVPVFLVALTLIGWTESAQFVRGQVQVIRQMNYIEGAEAAGLSRIQIIVRHAWPNLLPELLVFAFLEMGAVLFLMAELGFLGIYIGGGSFFALDPVFGRGAVPLMEVPEWGMLLGIGAPSLRSHPHLVWGPALAFALAIFGLNATGEGLRRLLEKAAVNTGMLLRKRMLLGVAGVVFLTWLVLRLTGPAQAYAQVARAFSGQRAGGEVAHLMELNAEETAVYIAQQFRQNELDRGVRIGINSFYEYLPEGARHPALLGFLPGFDLDLSDELIVIFTYYVPAEGEPAGANQNASGVATLLETVRLWQEQKVDPRRSVLFVAWGDDHAAARAFLEDPANFTKLPVPRREGITDGPATIIQLQNVGAGDEVLLLDPASDARLSEQFSAAVRAAGAEISLGTQSILLSDRVPSLAFQWQNGALPPAEDVVAHIEADKLQVVGEALSRMLLPLVRQDD